MTKDGKLKSTSKDLAKKKPEQSKDPVKENPKKANVTSTTRSKLTKK